MNPSLFSSVRQSIEQGYFDGISAILSAELDYSGNIVGQFADGPQVYDYEIDRANSLSYSEAEFRNDRWDSFARKNRVNAKNKCGNGKPCGKTCIESGDQCRIALTGMAALSAQTARAVLSSGSTEPATNSGQNSGNVPVMKSARKFLSGFNAAKIAAPAAVFILGHTVRTVDKELAQSQVHADTLRVPPEGVADAKTYAKYDTFQPGDLIRKTFSEKIMGTRYHYAVYMGKDEKTGKHMVAEVVDSKYEDQTLGAQIRYGEIHPDSLTKGSEYEAVPREFMYRHGDPGLSREKVVARARAMAGKNFTYVGFSSNCETFARGIVEGKVYGTQSDRIGKMTEFISDTFIDIGMKTNGFAPKHLVKGSAYDRDKTRMSAQEMVDALQKMSGLSVSGLSQPKKDADIIPLDLKTKQLPNPKEFDDFVEKFVAQVPKLADLTRVELYKLYIMAMFAQHSALKAGKRDSAPTDLKQKVPLLLKQAIEGGFNSGITAVRSAKLVDGKSIEGQFIAAGKAYDYRISEDNKLTYVESSPKSKVRKDSMDAPVVLQGVNLNSANIARSSLRIDALQKKQACDCQKCEGNCNSDKDMKSQHYLDAFDRQDRQVVDGQLKCKTGTPCGKRCLPRGQKCREGGLNNAAPQGAGSRLKQAGSVIGTGVLAGAAIGGTFALRKAKKGLSAKYAADLERLKKENASKRQTVNSMENAVSQKEQELKSARQFNEQHRRVSEKAAREKRIQNLANQLGVSEHVKPKTESQTSANSRPMKSAAPKN